MCLCLVLWRLKNPESTLKCPGTLISILVPCSKDRASKAIAIWRSLMLEMKPGLLWHYIILFKDHSSLMDSQLLKLHLKAANKCWFPSWAHKVTKSKVWEPECLPAFSFVSVAGLRLRGKQWSLAFPAGSPWTSGRAKPLRWGQSSMKMRLYSCKNQINN